MSSPFFIQCAHVEPRELDNRVFDKITDVFPKLFWENHESAWLFWHQVPIRWHYTYELFANFNDILAVCRMMQQQDEGLTKACIQTDYLLFDWIFRWQGDELEMDASFTARRKSYEAYANALNRAPVVRMGKTEFLNEWTTMFHQMLNCFTAAGVVICEGTEAKKYEFLVGVVHHRKGYGKLYTKRA